MLHREIYSAGVLLILLDVDILRIPLIHPIPRILRFITSEIQGMMRFHILSRSSDLDTRNYSWYGNHDVYTTRYICAAESEENMRLLGMSLRQSFHVDLAGPSLSKKDKKLWISQNVKNDVNNISNFL
jgi:hypothetical protein